MKLKDEVLIFFLSFPNLLYYKKFSTHVSIKSHAK